VINYMFLCKRLKKQSSEMLEMNSLFECKRLKIAKFFTLKRSKMGGGSAITAPDDTNLSDATDTSN